MDMEEDRTDYKNTAPGEAKAILAYAPGHKEKNIGIITPFANQKERISKTAASRALGIKPYSTATEQAFLENLNHALDNVLNTNRRCEVKKEVAISHILRKTKTARIYFTQDDLISWSMKWILKRWNGRFLLSN